MLSTNTNTQKRNLMIFACVAVFVVIACNQMLFPMAFADTSVETIKKVINMVCGYIVKPIGAFAGVALLIMGFIKIAQGKAENGQKIHEGVGNLIAGAILIFVVLFAIDPLAKFLGEWIADITSKTDGLPK